MESELNIGKKALDNFFHGRVDINVVGKFDDYELPFYPQKYQEIEYSEYVIAPVRPTLSFRDYERFVKSIENDFRREFTIKKTSSRAGSIEFSVLSTTDVVGYKASTGDEKKTAFIDYRSALIYPNEDIAWLISEYNKARQRNLITSKWNKIEAIKHSMPADLIASKKGFKAMVYELYEGELFRLIK